MEACSGEFKKAAATADQVAAAFGREDRPEALKRRADPTLGELFDKYLREETPHKGKSKRAHDRRAAKMFEAFFGRKRKAMTLNWETGSRSSAPEGRKRPACRQACVQEGAEAVRTGRARGRGPAGRVRPQVPLGRAELSRDDRERGGRPPHPAEPAQAVRARPALAQGAEPDAARAHGAAVPRVARGGEGIDWRFHLALVLAHETGHRIKSIRRLRWSDVDPEGGWVRWRKENDKVDWEHRTPLSEEARAALRRARLKQPTLGVAWVFPSPEDGTRPCSRHIRDWWDRGQQALEEQELLKDVKGLGWHSLRRKFATDFRDLPLKDLAVLGGWKDTRTILQCYQQGSEERMREAIESRPRRAGGRGIN